ncbi:hypothetical protein RHGRI_015987 [Rhododendron griersonianum]|uniref:Uncharacterized protein n=1 Tax=Rhododendron griersonianum TaxID=479676 RepID=A0AAV6JPH0_9ERIC|nr:hypothetical protein RHGRI_015987 [Rhododendron griersonianum]
MRDGSVGGDRWQWWPCKSRGREVAGPLSQISWFIMCFLSTFCTLLIILQSFFIGGGTNPMSVLSGFDAVTLSNAFNSVDNVNSDLYNEFLRKLRESTIVAIDAEWVPRVPLCLLQFAFRTPSNDDEVFMLGLVTIPLGTVYDALKAMVTE